MTEALHLDYLQWQALLVLYRHRDRQSSPLRYVGLEATIGGLIKYHPPLAQWVGKPSEKQVHITTEGISLYEVNDKA